MTLPRLHTLAYSHYNEKARWALDFCQVAYVEVPHLPMWHFLSMRKILRGQGRRDKMSSAYSLPVLQFGDGSVLADSSDIMQFASASLEDNPLYTSETAAEWDQWCNEEIGPHARRIAVYYLLQVPEIYARLIKHNYPTWQYLLYRASSILIRKGMEKGLQINQARMQRSVSHLRERFREVDAQLAKTPFLAGDTFSAADLSFAALAAPVLSIQVEEGYGAWLPPIKDTPPGYQALIHDFRNSRAGQHALKMFAQYR